MLIRLTAESLPFWVEVDVRDYDSRWIAVADLAGEHDLGLGLTARQAIKEALASLGPRTAAEVLSGVGDLDDRQASEP